MATFLDLTGYLTPTTFIPAKEDGDVRDDNCASAPYRNAKPAEIITFGIYPQTADGADRTPIKWRVLQNSGSELLILFASS